MPSSIQARDRLSPSKCASFGSPGSVTMPGCKPAVAAVARQRRQESPQPVCELRCRQDPSHDIRFGQARRQEVVPGRFVGHRPVAIRRIEAFDRRHEHRFTRRVVHGARPVEGQTQCKRRLVVFADPIGCVSFGSQSVCRRSARRHPPHGAHPERQERLSDALLAQGHAGGLRATSRSRRCLKEHGTPQRGVPAVRHEVRQAQLRLQRPAQGARARRPGVRDGLRVRWPLREWKTSPSSCGSTISAIVSALTPMSAGNLCALAIEASQRGLIEEDMDFGVVPDCVGGSLRANTWVTAKAFSATSGPRASCGVEKKYGLEGIAVHCKGMEPAGYDPRAQKGMGLGFATTTRGACHLRVTMYKPQLIGGSTTPQEIVGKVGHLLRLGRPTHDHGLASSTAASIATSCSGRTSPPWVPTPSIRYRLHPRAGCTASPTDRHHERTTSTRRAASDGSREAAARWVSDKPMEDETALDFPQSEMEYMLRARLPRSVAGGSCRRSEQ